jgi:hypothetical protein
MVYRAPIPQRNITLIEPIFERSRLSEQFLASAYEQVLPIVQRPIESRPEVSSRETQRPQAVRRA